MSKCEFELTPFDIYLLSLPKSAEKEGLIAWVESRPPAVRDLLKRFPPGTCLDVEGKTAHVIGFNETKDDPPFAILSYVNPCEDYGRAIEEKFYICSSHLK